MCGMTSNQPRKLSTKLRFGNKTEICSNFNFKMNEECTTEIPKHSNAAKCFNRLENTESDCKCTYLID